MSEYPEFLAKIRNSGNSYIITVPKKIVEAYSLYRKTIRLKIIEVIEK